MNQKYIIELISSFIFLSFRKALEVLLKGRKIADFYIIISRGYNQIIHSAFDSRLRLNVSLILLFDSLLRFYQFES